MKKGMPLFLVLFLAFLVAGIFSLLRLPDVTAHPEAAGRVVLVSGAFIAGMIAFGVVCLVKLLRKRPPNS